MTDVVQFLIEVTATGVGFLGAMALHDTIKRWRE